MSQPKTNIAICGSPTFTPKMKVVSSELERLGYLTSIPINTSKVISRKFTLGDLKREKKKGVVNRARSKSIKRYWKTIENADAILVLNFTDKGIKNYIGGSAFLEMGYAHLLDKRIVLLNGLPKISYRHEIKAMQPEVLKGDLHKIVEYI